MSETPDTPHVHKRRFDGDDPYLVCTCGARWDALTGRPIGETPDTPSTEARPDCEHVSIVRWSGPDGTPRLWACQTCRVRFYPACPTCVTVGHRGERHE